MKSTGIVRNLDDLGRVTLPKELRSTLDIGARDPLEIYTDGSKIVLEKYQLKRCTFCSTTEDLVEFKGKYVCQECKKEMTK